MFSTTNFTSSYDYLLKDKGFTSLNNYEERIKYVLKKIKSLSDYKEEIFEKATLYQKRHTKCANKSKSFRFEGQYYYDRRQYKSAKQWFTKAILSAPDPNQCNTNDRYELSLCYGFRSLTFFQMKDYENALFDVNQSLDCSHSSQMISHKIVCILYAKGFKQMTEFIDNCIQRIDNKEFEEKNNFTKEFLNRLKKIKFKDITDFDQKTKEEVCVEKSKDLTNVWLNSKVAIKGCPQKGRHLVANDDIENNVLIIREKVSQIVYFGPNIYNYCCNCDKQIDDRIFVCFQCNEVVFCSQNCSHRAINDFHRYECGITGLIFKLGSNALQVYRTFVEFGRNSIDFETTTKQDFDFVNYFEEESQQIGIERTENQKSKQFQFISNLVEGSEKHTKTDWINTTFTSIELTILLHFRQILDQNIIYDIQSFAKYGALVSSYLNSFTNNVFGRFEDREEDTHVFNCLCISSAIFSHSCDPNTEWYFENNFINFKTNRDLKKFEEFTINYEPLESTPLIDRQIKIWENHNFVCNCELCIKSCLSVPSLKCLDCEGPIIYKPETNFNFCLNCRQKYPNLKEVIKKVNILSENFKKRVQEMAKDINREKALRSAQNIIESLKQYVHSSSFDLLNDYRNLIKICFHFSEIQKSIEFSKHLWKSIEFQTKDCEKILVVILDDMFLLTRIYYNYLSQNQIEDINEWKNAFHIFEITIDLLERVKQKKAIKENQTSNSMLNHCIKYLKQEFKHLKESEKEYFDSKIDSKNSQILENLIKSKNSILIQ